MKASRLPALPVVSWLDSLSQEYRDLLSSYGEIVDFEENAIIIREKDPQPYLYFILTGLVSVYRGQEGNASVLAVLGPGEAIGEIAMMIRGRASANVSAMEKTRAWRIQHDDLHKFIDAHPKIGNRVLMSLIFSLAERLVSMNADLALLLSPDSMRKLFLTD